MFPVKSRLVILLTSGELWNTFYLFSKSIKTTILKEKENMRNDNYEVSIKSFHKNQTS